ncbi:hypothetical protein PAEVO_55080 [Paenibacillus sp. GM2FR]|uniref:hypothetical protein n=1 Tax=Paenibacillus sp. GM2FR TaxID=2059268 RepID=UPI000C275ABB|nr:hypothetical protein [Paenibacillus sp. GM2FR]PJN50464.1 hypothetical protein PAEVO_55080 [Paenibacillus sp. GM2FR]
MRIAFIVLGVFKGLTHWFLKPRRRYTSNNKVEWMVERLIQGFLIMWAILFIRWVILISIATMRHFGIID